MGAARIVLYEAGSTDEISIWDFASSDWTQTGNSLSVLSNGHQGVCGIDSDNFALLNTSGTDDWEGYAFDETDITAEGTDLSDSGSDWSSWPTDCTKINTNQYIATSWGEGNLHLITLTCS